MFIFKFLIKLRLIESKNSDLIFGVIFDKILIRTVIISSIIIIRSCGRSLLELIRLGLLMMVMMMMVVMMVM